MTEANLQRLLSRAQELEPGARYDEALQDLESVLQQARQSRLVAFEAEALLHRGRILRIKGELETAERSALDAAELFLNSQDFAGQARALLVVAEVLSDRADLVEFERVTRQALELAQAAPDASAEARANTLLAAAHLYQGRPADAVEACQQALFVYGAMSDRRGTAATQMLLSRAELSRGNIGPATSALEAALRVFEDLGEQRALTSVLFNLGQMLFERQELDDARGYTERGVEIAGGSGDAAMQARHLLLRGQIDVELGRYDQALDGLLQARAICDEHRLTSIGPEVDRTAAQALLGLGRVDQAGDAATRAVQGASADDPYSRGTTNLVQALVYGQSGNADQAGGSFRAALEFLEEAAEAYELGWGHREFGVFLTASGQRPEAREELQRAREAFQRLQAARRVENVDSLLSSLA